MGGPKVRLRLLVQQQRANRLRVSLAYRRQEIADSGEQEDPRLAAMQVQCGLIEDRLRRAILSLHSMGL